MQAIADTNFVSEIILRVPAAAFALTRKPMLSLLAESP